MAGDAMNNQRSLVTGESGFIGSHVVRLLHKKRDTVRILELQDVPFACRVRGLSGSVFEIETVPLSCGVGHRSFIWQAIQIISC